MLLRPDSGDASVARFLARIERSPQRDRIDCRVGMLSADELRAELTRCHAFLLPFRVTISEVPLVVIEAGLSGRPTIVLAAPGVDEIASRLGGIVASSAAALPAALLQAARRPPARPRDTAAWTDWPGAVGRLLEPGAAGLARYRLVALAGVDGGGKTFLLGALQRPAGRGRRAASPRLDPVPQLSVQAVPGAGPAHRPQPQGGAGRRPHRLPRFCRPAVAGLAVPVPAGDRQSARHLVALPSLARTGAWCWPTAASTTRWSTSRSTPASTTWCSARSATRLVRLLPAPRLVVVLDRPVAAIRATRPDVLLDRNFARRRTLYQRLARGVRPAGAGQ